MLPRSSFGKWSDIFHDAASLILSLSDHLKWHIHYRHWHSREVLNLFTDFRIAASRSFGTTRYSSIILPSERLGCLSSRHRYLVRIWMAARLRRETFFTELKGENRSMAEHWFDFTAVVPLRWDVGCCCSRQSLFSHRCKVGNWHWSQSFTIYSSVSLRRSEIITMISKGSCECKGWSPRLDHPKVSEWFSK
jgi:hypothetical protein